ncbi:hypothetical protein LCGC14_1609110 [marine sediment metagenome]|uniref:Uncharacterized protein n=1 Tax=marine sediment metagenome TaxID=412755 RepID=A0A0F9I8V9_9ZZZZ
MNFIRSRHKRNLCIAHRQERYLHALGKVMDGKADPNYATLRWEKLKAINKDS